MEGGERLFKNAKSNFKGGAVGLRNALLTQIQFYSLPGLPIGLCSEVPLKLFTVQSDYCHHFDWALTAQTEY